MAEKQSEPMVKPVGQVVIEAIEKETEPLANSVTAVLSPDQNGDAELIGSAVLIDLSGEVFFCTAKHVTDLCTKGLFVDAPSGNEPLNGKFKISEVHDLAVLKLSPEQGKLFDKYQPLSADFIGNHDEASQCNYAQFIGFPVTKNRRRRGERETKGPRYSNGCSVTEVSFTKIHLAFERRHSVSNGSRQEVTAPDPYGMSGGGIFGVQGELTGLERGFKPKLIGISTDWPNEREVFGTNMALVLATIRDGYQLVLPDRLNPRHINVAKIV